MSDNEPTPPPPDRTINLAAVVIGGMLFLPLMAVSCVALYEGIDGGEGHFIISTLLQIFGLGFLWWRIAVTTRWPLIFLYILIAACFYVLMIGLCATGI